MSATLKAPSGALLVGLCVLFGTLVPEAPAQGQQVPAFTLSVERNMTCLDQSTIGRLIIDGQEVGRTLELPWRNNETSVSRIPPGTYAASMRTDGARGWRVELADVRDRKKVQMHIGNYARETEGCILVGDNVTEDKGNKACMVTNSAATIDAIRGRIRLMGESVNDKMTVSVPIRVVVK